MRRSFEIWSEGFAVTGQSSQAICHGNVLAETFREACDKHFGDDTYYDSSSLHYWACKLFDNETDARKNFG